MKSFLPVLLLLCCSAVQAADNVVIVLDTSGSMGERMRGVNVQKMQAAQEALVSVIGSIPPTTNVGLVTFNGWAYMLGPVDKDKMDAAIRATQPSGGTPLGEFIKAGADALLQAREKEKGIGTFKLLVVTDGEATDAWKVDQYLPLIIQRGIQIDSIGVDMRADHSLSKTSRHYMKADDPNSLKQAVSSVLSEVSSASDDVSGFADISGLPDNVAHSIILNLIEPRNYPIGEQPPVAATVQYVDEQGNITHVEQTPPTPVKEGMSVGMIILCFVGGVLLLLVLGAVVCSNS